MKLKLLCLSLLFLAGINHSRIIISENIPSQNSRPFKLILIKDLQENQVISETNKQKNDDTVNQIGDFIDFLENGTPNDQNHQSELQKFVANQQNPTLPDINNPNTIEIKMDNKNSPSSETLKIEDNDPHEGTQPILENDSFINTIQVDNNDHNKDFLPEVDIDALKVSDQSQDSSLSETKSNFPKSEDDKLKTFPLEVNPQILGKIDEPTDNSKQIVSDEVSKQEQTPQLTKIKDSENPSDPIIIQTIKSSENSLETLINKSENSVELKVEEKENTRESTNSELEISIPQNELQTENLKIKFSIPENEVESKNPEIDIKIPQKEFESTQSDKEIIMPENPEAKLKLSENQKDSELKNPQDTKSMEQNQIYPESNLVSLVKENQNSDSDLSKVEDGRKVPNKSDELPLVDIPIKLDESLLNLQTNIDKVQPLINPGDDILEQESVLTLEEIEDTKDTENIRITDTKQENEKDIEVKQIPDKLPDYQKNLLKSKNSRQARKNRQTSFSNQSPQFKFRNHRQYSVSQIVQNHHKKHHKKRYYSQFKSKKNSSNKLPFLLLRSRFKSRFRSKAHHKTALNYPRIIDPPIPYFSNRVNSRFSKNRLNKNKNRSSKFEQGIPWSINSPFTPVVPPYTSYQSAPSPLPVFPTKLDFLAHTNFKSNPCLKFKNREHRKHCNKLRKRYAHLFHKNYSYQSNHDMQSNLLLKNRFRRFSGSTRNFPKRYKRNYKKRHFKGIKNNNTNVKKNVIYHSNPFDKSQLQPMRIVFWKRCKYESIFQALVSLILILALTLVN